MVTRAINVSIEESILEETDALVKEGKFVNRSQLVAFAIKAYLKQLDEERIGREAQLLGNAGCEEWLQGEADLWAERY